MDGVRVGTCSWNYPSWGGLVYQSHGRASYLEQYTRRFTTVEIDRWFWSLFEDPDRVRLPEAKDVAAYRSAAPASFRFGVKAPNAITLTHLYRTDRRSKTELLRENPHFLSAQLAQAFLDSVHGLADVLGPVMFQFEYLNKQKMPSASAFFERLRTFARDLPREVTFAVETRNPHYVGAAFFDLLRQCNLCPVLLSGYWMPSLARVFHEYRDLLLEFPTVVFRLMGEGREDIEETTGGRWDSIVKPHDEELEIVAAILKELSQHKVSSFVFVNNHYEGSAPLTVDKLLGCLRSVEASEFLR